LEQTYYGRIRSEISPVLPGSASYILDVGAGEGRTSAWLRERYPGSRSTALECNSEVLETLRANVDDPRIVDLNAPLPSLGSPDLILCLDVLEHLPEPEKTLKSLVEFLARDGTVIVSVPNVAHLSVSFPLMFRGRFAYQDSGILDRTHLRFFVRSSAVALMNSAGLVVQRGIRTGMRGPKARIANLLTMGLLRDHFTKQYIMVGKRMPDGEKQGATEWLVY
jgi:2-polyprenyl-3-methyl-5-hydroxy-6-metoxy-1,4-benzoquinol methylase